MKKIYKYEIIGFFAILFLIGIYYLTKISVLDIDKLREIILNYGFLGHLILIGIFTVFTLIGTPLSLLITITGVIFGIRNGFFISLIFLTLAGSIAFLISKFLKSKLIKNTSDEETKNIIIKIRDIIENHLKKSEILSVVLMRLMFLPYIETSFASGLVSKLRFSSFFIGTFLINILYCIIYLFIGERITQNFKWFGLGIFIIIIILMIPRLLKYLKLHRNIH